MRIATVAILACVVITGTARADESKEVRMAFANFGFAVSAKNLGQVHALEAPGFTATENGKKYNASQFDGLLKRQFAAQPTIIYFRVKNQSIKESGNTVTLDGDFWYRGQLPAAPGARRPPALDISGKIISVLVKSGSGYKFKSIDQTVTITAIAGKRQAPAPSGFGTVP